MRYVVIGASAAGISGAKTLRELDKDAEIVLVSKDENVYSRCILHHYISNHRDVDALNFTSKNFFEENTNTLKKETKKLPEVRCKICNRLLFCGKVQYVEIKCPKCRKIQRVGKCINDICIKD